MNRLKEPWFILVILCILASGLASYIAHNADMVVSPPIAEVEYQNSNFGSVLEEQMLAKGDLSIHERRILQILQQPDSPRKTRQLNRMEKHVRLHLGYSDDQAVNWAEIDWATVFWTILKILVAILPLLLLL